jgi:hypothetical protein
VYNRVRVFDDEPETSTRTMNKFVFLLSSCLQALLSLTAAADAIVPTERIPLFNGHDLTGFYTFLETRGRDNDPMHVFTVQDGELRIAGDEWGGLITKDEYRDYRIVAEYRWGDEAFGRRAKNARNNGMLIHSTGPDGGFSGIWMRSLECQIIEGGTGDLLMLGDGSPEFALTVPTAAERHGKTPVYEEGGTPVTVNRGRINWWGRDPGWKDALGFRGAKDLEKPVGEWNRLEAIARGDTVEVVLNGVVVNKAIHVKPSAGRIQIQNEGAEIHFRRIDLLPLTAADTAGE